MDYQYLMVQIDFLKAVTVRHQKAGTTYIPNIGQFS